MEWHDWCLTIIQHTWQKWSWRVVGCVSTPHQHSHQVKPLVLVVSHCLALLLIGRSVQRTSTSCEWVFSRDESTGECVLGCQSVLSSLFVFFFPSFPIFSLFFLVLFFTLHSFFCMHTHQHLMPLLTHSVHSIDSLLHPMCVIHHHKHTQPQSLS